MSSVLTAPESRTTLLRAGATLKGPARYVSGWELNNDPETTAGGVGWVLVTQQAEDAGGEDIGAEATIDAHRGQL